MTKTEENQNKSELKDLQYNEDKELLGSRKILTVFNFLIFAMLLTDGTVKEANTFIFKLEFKESNGILYLIILTSMFLLLRYIAHTHQYMDKLTQSWANKVKEDPLCYSYDEVNNESYGLILNEANSVKFAFAPEELDPNCEQMEEESRVIYRNARIQPRAWLNARIFYSTEYIDKKIGVWSFESKLDSIRFLRLLIRKYAISFLTERVYIEIYSPIFLSVIAYFYSFWFFYIK